MQRTRHFTIIFLLVPSAPHSAAPPHTDDFSLYLQQDDILSRLLLTMAGKQTCPIWRLPCSIPNHAFPTFPAKAEGRDYTHLFSVRVMLFCGSFLILPAFLLCVLLLVSMLLLLKHAFSYHLSFLIPGRRILQHVAEHWQMTGVDRRRITGSFQCG